MITATKIFFAASADNRSENGKRLRDALYELTFPRSASGELYEGAAEYAFDLAFSRVALKN